MKALVGILAVLLMPIATIVVAFEVAKAFIEACVEP